VLRNTGVVDAEWQEAEQLQTIVDDKLSDIERFNELLRSAQPILKQTIKKLQEDYPAEGTEAALENALFDIDIDSTNV